MSTKTSLTISLTIAGVEEEIEVEAEGWVSFGRAPKGPSYACAGGEPGEDAEIEDLCVGLYSKPRGLAPAVFHDLTPFLTKKQIKAVEEQIFEAEIGNRETPTYERD